MQTDTDKRPTVTVRLDPEVRKALEATNENLIAVQRLLADNAKLLAELLQRPLETV